MEVATPDTMICTLLASGLLVYSASHPLLHFELRSIGSTKLKVLLAHSGHGDMYRCGVRSGKS